MTRFRALPELQDRIAQQTSEFSKLTNSIATLSISLTATLAARDVCSEILSSLKNAPQRFFRPPDDVESTDTGSVQQTALVQARALKLEAKLKQISAIRETLGSTFPAPELTAVPTSQSDESATLFGRYQEPCDQFAALKRERRIFRSRF
jgi:hypothetical protein